MLQPQHRRPGRAPWPLHGYLLALAALVACVGVSATVLVERSTSNGARMAAREAAASTARLGAARLRRDIHQVERTVVALAAEVRTAVREPGCLPGFPVPDTFAGARLDLVSDGGEVVCSSSGGAGATQPDYRNGAFDDLVGQATQGSAALTVREGNVVVVAAGASRRVTLVALLETYGTASRLASQFGGRRRFDFLLADTEANQVVATSTEADRPVAEASIPPRRSARVFEWQGGDGVARLYGQAQLPELGWTIYAAADLSEMLAPARRVFGQTASVLVFAALVTFSSLWIVWRRIAKPMRALRAATRSARLDPSHRAVAVRGPAEIEQLGAEFDALLRAQKERTRALEESEARYREMFERASEGIAVTTPDGAILEANPALATMLGYESEVDLMASIRSAWGFYVDPADRYRALDALAEERPVEMEMTLRRADGGCAQVSIQYVPVLDDSGTITSVQTRVIDLTERKRLELQLAQSQRVESLGRLAGGIAHDFNNILAVILNYSSFVATTLRAAEPTDDLEQARADVEQIEAAALRASSLTRRLLTFARQDVVRPEVIDPTHVVAETERLLTRTIGEDIHFTTTQAEGIWPVHIDPGQLQQVILNLAMNARDAMPFGGTLTIETSNVVIDDAYRTGGTEPEPGRYVRFRVSDTGTGMSPHVADKIFDAFFTTKPTGEGTGIGLATVHDVVAQGGGSIHVYTEPDIGTSISVLLPATDLPVSGDRSQPSADLTGSETVLVVEDEEAIREVIRRILSRSGYEVIIAPSADEAVDIARDASLSLDLVVSDVVMPGMLAREFASYLSEARPRLPLIYMSGYARAVLDSRGRLEPGRALLEKPFTEEQLLSAVREALDGAPE